MRRVILFAFVAIVLPAASAQADTIPAGVIKIAEKFDASKGTPVEGYVSYAELSERASRQRVTNGQTPVRLVVPVGEYVVTGFWATFTTPPGLLDPPSNYCSAPVRLRRDDVRKVAVKRNALGCRVVVGDPPKRKCRIKGSTNGAKRPCRRKKVILHPPSAHIPPLGKPPVIPSVGVTPINHQYGSVPVGQSSPPLTMTFVNNTTVDKGPLSIGFTGSGTGQFVVSNDACTGATLGPAGTCTFDVAFSPTVAAFFYGSFYAVFPGGTGQNSSMVQGTGTP
jgi:hypothetical protein